jgi:hypothetical protein
MKNVLHPAVFKSYGDKKKKNMTKLYMDDSKEHLGRLGQTDREEILSEVWGAKKKLIDGKWYVELSEVAKIIGS